MHRPTPRRADRAVAQRQRGAIEAFLAEMQRTALVRLVRLQPAREGLRAVATFAYPEEAEGLIRRLRYHGLLTLVPDLPWAV